MKDTRVLAAGGVVLRPSPKGKGHEVLVVHRPNHKDWSLPKGKLDHGESFHETAVREIHEETGVLPRLGHELASVRYRDAQGRRKLVRYWQMSVHREGAWQPDDEVAEVAWWAVDKAARKLTYPHDQRLVERALQTPTTFDIAIVRHAHAGKRVDWRGDDGRRPLSKRGRRQAKQIAKGFRGRPVSHVVTSPLRRCRQTVAPLLDDLDMTPTIDKRLAEGASVDGLLDVFAGLGHGGVCCSHGAEIGRLLGALAEDSKAFPKQLKRPKGSVWRLRVGIDGRVERARHDPPVS